MFSFGNKKNIHALLSETMVYITALGLAGVDSEGVSGVQSKQNFESSGVCMFSRTPTPTLFD